eukprot:9475000-Pyramimonas_sp.AAC.1
MGQPWPLPHPWPGRQRAPPQLLPRRQTSRARPSAPPHRAASSSRAAWVSAREAASWARAALRWARLRLRRPIWPQGRPR